MWIFLFYVPIVFGIAVVIDTKTDTRFLPIRLVDLRFQTVFGLPVWERCPINAHVSTSGRTRRTRSNIDDRQIPRPLPDVYHAETSLGIVFWTQSFLYPLPLAWEILAGQSLRDPYGFYIRFQTLPAVLVIFGEWEEGEGGWVLMIYYWVPKNVFICFKYSNFWLIYTSLDRSADDSGFFVN